MTGEQLVDLRDRLHLDDVIPDEAFERRHPAVLRPPLDSAEFRYLIGPAPGARRSAAVAAGAAAPADDPAGRRDVRRAARRLEGQAVSTTMAFTRLLRNLCRDPEFGARVVPIIPDEARTFGMDSLFREFKIYASPGPALRTGRPRPAAVLQGEQGRPDPRGGHHRGRRSGRRGPRRPPATPPAACRWCRSSSSIRCSASSGSAT